MKKTVVLLLLVVCIAGSASAVTTSNDGWKGPAGGGTTQDWFTAANWQVAGVVPTIAADYATSGKYGVTTYNGTGSVNYDTSLTTCPIIANGNARAVEVRVGGQAVTVTNYTTAYLEMDSGTLKTMNFLTLGCNTGAGDRSGVLYMHGGVMTLGGATADGLDNGSRTTGHLYVGNGTISSAAMGTLFMDGGTIDAGASFTIANGLSGGQAYLSGTAIITANTFAMRPNVSNTNIPLLDISGQAKLVVNGNITGTLDTYKTNGWITTNGDGNGDLRYSFDTGTGKTTVWAAPEPTTVCLLGLGALGLLRRKK